MNPKQSRQFACVLGLSAALGLAGCEQRADTPPPVPALPDSAFVEDVGLDRQTMSVWQHGVSLLENSRKLAGQLTQAIDALLASPSDESLAAARTAWHKSHDAYLEFELFTALSGSNPGLFGSLREYDFAIEAWPIQPGYLDYFDVYSHSGIVNDIAMPLTSEALRQQHGFTDTTDVSLGFHAIEYLLWGESGQRPASDYELMTLSAEQGAADMRAVDLPNNRRRDFLRLLSNLLVDDMGAYQSAMENPNGLLRRSYMALQPHGRVLLLEGAAQAMLSHHRDLLQAQFDLRDEGEGQVVVFEDLRHSPYAGSNGAGLAQSLATLQRVLLDTREGLGDWIPQSGEQREETSQLMSRLQEELLSLPENTWPPEGEKGRSLVDGLRTLAERFEGRSMADSGR